MQEHSHTQPNDDEIAVTAEKKEQLATPIAIILAGAMIAGAILMTGGVGTGAGGTGAAAPGTTQKSAVVSAKLPIFDKCLASGKNADRVSRDANEGIKIGVQGTPYSIIWNKKNGAQVPVSGAYPIENVRTLLAQAQSANPPENKNKAPEEILRIKPDDHIRGNADSDIVIIEYSDLECPFCKRFHTTMQQLVKENGNIAWVYRHFPLDQIHPKARNEAAAAECVYDQGGNDMFWKYVDRTFDITPGNNNLDPAEIPNIAQFAGAK